MAESIVLIDDAGIVTLNGKQLGTGYDDFIFVLSQISLRGKDHILIQDERIPLESQEWDLYPPFNFDNLVTYIQLNVPTRYYEASPEERQRQRQRVYVREQDRAELPAPDVEEPFTWTEKPPRKRRSLDKTLEDDFFITLNPAFEKEEAAIPGIEDGLSYAPGERLRSQGRKRESNTLIVNKPESKMKYIIGLIVLAALIMVGISVATKALTKVSYNTICVDNRTQTRLPATACTKNEPHTVPAYYKTSDKLPALYQPVSISSLTQPHGNIEISKTVS